MNSKPTVLVVDDEPNIIEILQFNLRRAGFEVLSALDGAEGLKLAQNKSPDLILLDVMLPELNGFEVCRELRKTNPLVPVLMLTAREEERDKVMGLDSGADDYIVKPFGVKELIARVKTNLRRNAAMPAQTNADTAETITVGRLVLDTGAMSVLKDGRELNLTRKEFDILRFLAKAPGNIFSREELMAGVWNYDFAGDARLVDKAIARLRAKLEDTPAAPELLMSKHGAGYYLRVDS